MGWLDPVRSTAWREPISPTARRSPPRWRAAAEFEIRTDQRYDGHVQVDVPIVFMLSRHEERGPGAVLDERGRLLASASIFSSSGWLQWPVVDMYVHVFARLLRLAWPRQPVREPSADPLVLGHDGDHPAWPFYRTPTARLRAAVGAVIHRRDIGLALARTPLDGRSVEYGYLMDMSERPGLASTFFFLTRDSEVPAGSTYQITDGWCTGLMADRPSRPPRCPRSWGRTRVECLEARPVGRRWTGCSTILAKRG